jgi:hypothetical protein
MTEAQLKANRENAKLSRGPRTPEGKKRSSLNAFRHGLTGQIVVHTPEDQQAFTKHCDAIREDLDPEGAVETDLAQAIAEDRWRLNRARALENTILALGQSEHLPPDGKYSELDAALAQAQAWMDHAHHLNLLTTYENRIRRSVEKNTAELRARQAERKAPAAQEIPQKFLTVSFLGRRDKEYDPANDPQPESAGLSPAGQSSPARQGGDQPLGFVSSNPAIPNKTNDKTAPPQHPNRAPEPRNNPPEPTRRPTTDEVYAILEDRGTPTQTEGPIRGGEFARNPLGQLVPRR